MNVLKIMENRWVIAAVIFVILLALVFFLPAGDGNGNGTPESVQGTVENISGDLSSFTIIGRDGLRRTILLDSETTIKDVFGREMEAAGLEREQFVLAKGVSAGERRIETSAVSVLNTPQPNLITGEDSGRTFSYETASRFIVILNEDFAPKGSLSCSPGGVIGNVSNIPDEEAPLYALQYETVAPGRCTLQSGSFSVEIISRQADFEESGNLVRDNPGLPPGVWHISYEEPGSPALTKELVFDSGSACLIGGKGRTCDEGRMTAGRRVMVKGDMEGGSVVVLSIEGLDGNLY